ncbi:hypothetical protein JCM19274_3479 [Algibacter lectus]|uniref:Uncharacterized protein n=1 Tax=Algibacter lectus TaxID=221126 RepID=A0A090WPJ3_9FLAO|nr:DUF4907 domain-containing protein [Algibacter lectus]GAL78921.1 hypothetical protein JCM19274_3479 [Algibacter lectus]
MFRRKIILVLVVALVLTSGLYMANSDIFETSNPYKTEVFKVENGFGYQINYNSKLLIKQEYIPAVQLNKTFAQSKMQIVWLNWLVKNYIIKKIHR